MLRCECHLDADSGTAIVKTSRDRSRRPTRKELARGHLRPSWLSGSEPLRRGEGGEALGSDRPGLKP